MVLETARFLKSKLTPVINKKSNTKLINQPSANILLSALQHLKLAPKPASWSTCYTLHQNEYRFNLFPQCCSSAHYTRFVVSSIAQYSKPYGWPTGNSTCYYDWDTARNSTGETKEENASPSLRNRAVNWQVSSETWARVLAVRACVIRAGVCTNQRRNEGIGNNEGVPHDSLIGPISNLHDLYELPEEYTCFARLRAVRQWGISC